MTLLAGKAILITGAASGIGRAAALEFAAEGAAVIICDRDAAGLAETAAKLPAPGSAMVHQADVTDADGMATVVEAIVRHHGRLDGAFNNAGVEGNGGMFAAATDYPDEQYQQLMDINVRGVWTCMRAELAAMSRQGHGAIVNTASVAGLIGAPGQAAYAASKHAVVGLTRSLALEVAATGIRINAVAPGITETPMIIERGLVRNAGLEAVARAVIPMRRFAGAGEIACGVAWLLSDKASYVTGQVLPIDGGLCAQ